MIDRDKKLAGQVRLVRKLGLAVALAIALLAGLPLFEALRQGEAVHRNEVLPPILVFASMLGLFSLMESAVRGMNRDDRS